jgi:hypothetical protein
MKGGTQPIILMVMSLVVPWFCLASSAALPALASENVDAAAAALKAEYINMNFSTASATPDKYKSFIASVRAGLVSTAESTNGSGIPVLVSEDDPLALEAFLNVTLVNKAGRSVSLKMDVSGAYFAGYEAGNYSCLLKRSGSGRTVSSVTCYRNLYPWGGPPTVTVDDDPAAVAAWRVEDLDEAISSLFLFPTGNATKEDLSRGLAACDVMIASAATATASPTTGAFAGFRRAGRSSPPPSRSPTRAPSPLRWMFSGATGSGCRWTTCVAPCPWSPSWRTQAARRRRRGRKRWTSGFPCS